MTAVFVGGSRHLSRLNEAIRKRLDELMNRGLSVYVGDANGADRAIQRYLASSGYRLVTVFAVKAHLRNNEGAWSVHYVAPPPNAKGYELYAAKDRVIADTADAGLMLWDGKSKGTFANIRALLARDKPLALYYSPKRKFLNFRSRADFDLAFPTMAAKLHADGSAGCQPPSVQTELLSSSSARSTT